MVRPFIFLSSLALPVALVYFTNWHALWVCALLSMGTLVFSTGRPVVRTSPVPANDNHGSFKPTTSMAGL